MGFKIWVLTITTLALGGCAHSLMRGTVAMKVSDTDAHVCLGNNEVKVGDRVTLFRNDCPSKGGGGRNGGGGGGGLCKKIKVGEGQVTQLLNEHYSAVRFEPGVQFEEGTIVERQ